MVGRARGLIDSFLPQNLMKAESTGQQLLSLNGEGRVQQYSAADMGVRPTWASRTWTPHTWTPLPWRTFFQALRI